ncbi:hypothetical protein BDZ94DRAFT_1226987 [Collybia nuda]|uniref:Glucose-methanol-choline oxidoreductase N-terminal domain-containing protein n=1 Tax=Collybia nuda TaxID=64659 RepID=A0A9P6CA73_9AGAR|nr:hypothetical protein BDZ94DRAFT_1226987 [Collybia nuda]
MTLPNALWTLFCFLTLAAPAFSALYTSPSQLPRDTFDYVIVGAGTAGNVVANRLSEVASVTVLVIEAGVTNEGVNASIIPLLGPSLTPNTPFDWNYTTTAQKAYGNRVIPYARGKMLGGSSSVNYMVYTRGSSDDFDAYAAITGDSGWGWENIKKYIPKHERWSAPADQHNTKGQFTPSAHGTDGLLQVSLPGFSTPLDQRIVDTLEEMEEFTFVEDMNSGSTLGIGWAQSSIGGGTRSSSATAYLGPNVMERSNLHVLVKSQVTKLLQTGIRDGIPVFHGLEFITTSEGPRRVTARKEIILSAGSIGTPQILQLSGIGGTSDLMRVGIKTIFNNPSVGQNLSDHPLLANEYSVKGTESYDEIFRSPTILNTNIERWLQNKTGPLASCISNHIGFFRLPDNSTILEGIEDPSSGPKGAHFELIFSNMWATPGIPAPTNGSFLTITTSVISPTSRGSVVLASSDPLEQPLINPNLLSTNFDKLTMRETIKVANRFITASPWKDYLIGPFGELAHATNDLSLDAYIAANAGTFSHPVGSAQMSSKDARYGVTDPDLKVKGVHGLRIIDASVMPFPPSAHPQAPLYLIAERGADLVKSSNTAFSDNPTSEDKNPSLSLTPSYLDLAGTIVAFLFSSLVHY